MKRAIGEVGAPYVSFWLIHVSQILNVNQTNDKQQSTLCGVMDTLAHPTTAYLNASRL